MGHANYTNLCKFWVNLLYARGRLTISQAVEVAAKRGEKLQASEGAYDAESGMVGLALERYVKFLQSMVLPRGYSPGQEQWHGPYLVAVLTPPGMIPRGYRPTSNVRAFLRQLKKEPDDAELHRVAADAIQDELGEVEWVSFVRDLPALRTIHRRWRDENDDVSDQYEWIDRIPWVFAPTWRKRYKSVPIISRVTT